MRSRSALARDAWERFVDAATDLLPALTNGTISAAELHEIAMHHAFDDHD